jgi:phage terminase large subunit GpA-like protein
MRTEITNTLLTYFNNSFSLPWTGSIVEWLGKNVTFPEDSPNPGSFNIGISPWLEDVYKAIQNPEIEVVILQGASQTYKTGVTETIIPYWICNDPAKVLRIHHTKDVAKNFTKTRLYPMLKACEPVNIIMGNTKTKPSTDLILFPNMSITITGPTENFQHGFSVQNITIDEAHLINDPGIYEKFFRRTDQYKGKRKIIISTTPGEEQYKNGVLVGDELALLVNSGRIFRRSWKCPHCEKNQVWRWSNKREDGTYSGINWGESIIIAVVG